MRQTFPVAIPRSCSVTIAMICSSVNFGFLIVRLLVTDTPFR